MVNKLTEYERQQAVVLLRKVLTDLNSLKVSKGQDLTLRLSKNRVKSALAYLKE